MVTKDENLMQIFFDFRKRFKPYLKVVFMCLKYVLKKIDAERLKLKGTITGRKIIEQISYSRL